MNVFRILAVLGLVRCSLSQELCSSPVDLLFVLDESNSIAEWEFDFAKDAIIALVDSVEVGPDDAQIGLVKFDTDASIEFDLDEHRTRDDVAEAVRDVGFVLGGKTNIDLAFQRALEVGGKRRNVQGIIILMTDGTPTEGDPTVPTAQDAKSEGWIVVSVAIGDNVDFDLLADIASEPDFVLEAEDFEDLVRVLEDFEICEILSDPTPSSPEECNCPPGPPGPSGRDGSPGPPGRDGEDGRHGEPGEDGRDGSPGEDGRDGEPGEDGRDGSPGEDGRDGSPGEDGRDGPPGEDGRDGSPGEDGRNGEPGEDGRDGSPGEDGHDGPPGEHGRDGSPGEDGRNGEPGEDGRDGSPGEDGRNGEPGEDGRDGSPGEDGRDGEPGEDGRDGSPGEDGRDGSPGEDGEAGPPGRDGSPGEDGRDGSPGEDGRDGSHGRDGEDGERGPPGSNGLDGRPGSDGERGRPGYCECDSDSSNTPSPPSYSKLLERRDEVTSEDVLATIEAMQRRITQLETQVEEIRENE